MQVAERDLDLFKRNAEQIRRDTDGYGVREILGFRYGFEGLVRRHGLGPAPRSGGGPS